MSVFYAALICTIISSIAIQKASPVPNTNHLVPLSKACEAGAVAENECNKCVCTSEHFFNCTSKPCNQTVIQNLKGKVSCKAGMLYIKNATVCLCKEDGFWPHNNCKTAFNSFHVKSKDSCKPNHLFIVDCNVCKCGPDGIINKTRCTKNNCTLDLNKSRRFIKQNQVYGSCEAQNWYSLAPCQFCFCISENKLVCNTGNSYSKKLQLGSYNLSICGKELIRDAINLIPDRDKALRFGINKTVNELGDMEITTEYHQDTELNRESNENIMNQQMKEQQVPILPVKQQPEKITKNSQEYYSDTEEAKGQMPIGREGSSTKLPYEDDENNPSSDSDNENQAPVDQFEIEIDPTRSTDEPPVNTLDPLRAPPNPTPHDFPEHFEWTGPASENGQVPSEAFNLGDVLKPYLPVVLDKVFQMALRKSMVSVDAHSNCTPGATTVFKCNACFCLKNNKLLCTKNECK